MVLLGSTMSHLRPRFAYTIGNDGHARSQGGRQPAATKPRLFDIRIMTLGWMMDGIGMQDGWRIFE